MSRPRYTRTRITTPEVRGGAAPADVPQLLRLLHLASPALPIGAFHFSQGLEYAVEVGWVRDESSALEWIGGIAQGSVATLDLPVLWRLQAAWTRNDVEAVLRWNAFLLACRETAELRLEDRHLGAALMRALFELGLVSELFTPKEAATTGVAHATAFAFACARWDVTPRAMLETYAWAWAENQTMAALKLVPLGQNSGLRILHSLGPRLAACAARAADFADSDIGISTSISAVASGRHESQYTRLFRS